MYALAQRAVGGLRTTSRVAKNGGVAPQRKMLVARVKLQRMTVRWAASTGGAGGILKLEGQAALPKKLEDPIFRRDFILNPKVPPGRDIWTDNERLDIRFESDPLAYTWPEGEDFSSYDPVLKRNWEDDMFETKWNGQTKGQVQGGDWANTRISTEVPPRIKIYYANIVKKMQEGALIGATIVFNALLSDFLAPRGSIPYGVYHTMMIIYKARGKLNRAYDMFNEILTHHTPTSDDYATGMEILLAMKRPSVALDVWRSFQTRPSMKPNAAMYVQLLRTYALIGDIEKMESVYQQINGDKADKEFYMSLLMAIIQIYAELGHQPELLNAVEAITPTFGLSSKLQALDSLILAGLYDEALAKYSDWGLRMDGPPYATNVLIKAFTEKLDIPSLEKVLTSVNDGQLGVLDTTAYGYLIAKHRQLSDSDLVSSAAQQGLSLQTIRASIRNYRAVRTANILAYASSNYAPVQTAIDELEEKEITWDASFFEAVALAHQTQKTTADALKLWNQYVIQLKLVPTRLSFSYFFNLAGLERNIVNVALIARLARVLSIKPDFRFASALALALNPNRNYFGLIQMRIAHQRWTEHPTSPRVLNMQENQEFDQFIDHAISTFSENDQRALETAWKKMLKELRTPRPAETQVNDAPSRPIFSQTTDVVRRIFSSTLPEPSMAQADNIAADVAREAEAVAQDVSLDSTIIAEQPAEDIETEKP